MLVVEHVATISISQFHGKCTIMHVLFAVYFANSISHFAFSLYQHPPLKGTAMKNQKLTPAALAGMQFRWAVQDLVWKEMSVCFVCVLFFYVMFIIYYIYLYIYIYIRFYNNKYNNNAIIIFFITRCNKIILTNQLINNNNFNLII